MWGRELSCCNNTPKTGQTVTFWVGWKCQVVLRQIIVCFAVNSGYVNMYSPGLDILRSQKRVSIDWLDCMELIWFRLRRMAPLLAGSLCFCLEVMYPACVSHDFIPQKTHLLHLQNVTVRLNKYSHDVVSDPPWVVLVHAWRRFFNTAALGEWYGEPSFE